ncbi:xanthine dehydrogenase family protein molybdopterin-binding subunit [Mesorhizobium sp. ES1-4]|uniref:xanthine dehydrogenase family protein molybdopterin-binding subunit n=1 Tax=Mesorhizobium sp. ES1-4 TaxID=2876627 RepID=UPI001CCC5309|nr:molybdopterin cofactor-binding domain-containing protein [Mesorhizobium sp. ES1-4]MBZ9798684.1 molybdopterin-dependent oxidoreductase [Mesorhizobium sp. ES1-4]
MNQISCRVPLIDGVEKVTGALRFTADMNLDGLLHCGLLFSPRAHARVAYVNAHAALAVEGVRAVFWHENTPAHHYNSSIWFAGQDALKDERMFAPVARHIGDRVAAVVADTEEIARHAARLIAVEYVDLPPIFAPEAALTHAGHALREDDIPTFRNPVADEVFIHGNPEAGFAAADLIVEARITTPRSHHCAIETHACIARPEPDGRILVLSPCQSVFAVQAVVAQALNLPQEKIRVMKTPIGGSFGGKAEPILDPLCAFFALTLRRPVVIRYNRHETFTATRTRSSVTGRMRIGLSSDGRILARDTETLVDVGAYCTGGNYLPSSMLQRLVRLYDVPAERYRGRAVYTNTTPSGAFRGYGSPQIHTVAEITLDIAARRLRMDPVILRLRNLVGPGAIEPLQGLDVGNARGRDCLMRGAAAFDWSARWQIGTGAGRWRRGVGVAAATHINGCYPGFHEETTATLRLLPRGRAELVCALHDLGCGADTTLAQIAGETLGLRACDIVIVPADTDTCPYDLGTRASRMTYICGEAIRRAGTVLAAAIRTAAGLELNAEAGDLRLAAGAACRPDGSGLTLAELAGRLFARGADLPAATETYRAQANPGSYAAHFAEVEVDTLTGRVRVTDYLAVHDVGRAINPMLVEGQIHGGIQIGVGYALYEDVAIDPLTGRMRGDSFSRYTLANASVMPPMRVLLIEEGEPTGPFGAKAVGEIATIPVAAAVVNAVNNALGTELTHLPVTPERVLAAMNL